jgi:hypothetical protein
MNDLSQVALWRQAFSRRVSFPLPPACAARGGEGHRRPAAAVLSKFNADATHRYGWGDFLGAPHPAHIAAQYSPTLPARGRVKSIVLAMRLRIRAMPRHCHAKHEGGEQSGTGGGACLCSSLKPLRKCVARMERSEIRDNRFRLDLAPGLRCASSGLRTKENVGSETPTDATVVCHGVGHGRACSGRRTSIGVPPRFWLRRPNATTRLQFRAS